MASSFKSQLFSVRKAYEKAFDSEMLTLAQGIGRQVRGAAVNGVVPDDRRTRDQLKQRIWLNWLKPYFVGAGQDALEGAVPQSPYALLIRSGIKDSLGVVADQQISLIQKHCKEAAVLDWLTGSYKQMEREIGDFTYDPFHRFVDPKGYKLSDNIWQTSISVRARIDQLLDYEIPLGTAAVDIADMLEPYLANVPGQARWLTNKPYGVSGSYSARRLARTEITAAAGRGVVNASAINPYVRGIKWNLSPSHPKTDHCDDNAAGGEGGVYKLGSLPPYPDHPHCLCYLTPEVVKNPAQVTRDLLAQIRDVNGVIMAPVGNIPTRNLRGAFNRDWLVAGLLLGWVLDVF